MSRNRSYEDHAGNEWVVDVPEEERLIIPTVVLTSHFTASAAEDFLVMADNQPHITTIGHRSYGSTGQPLEIALVGGIGARICTKDDRFPDGRVFVGIGVIPDIELPEPTLAELQAVADPILDRALEWLRQQ